MKVLIIGGTGTISSPITSKLASNTDIDLYVLNRGNKKLPSGAKQIIGDFNDVEMMKELALKEKYDVVINFIVFRLEQAKAQIEIFQNNIKQYIFISTVATYNHETAVFINENHEQYNKYSPYGQEKAACEQLFLKANNFPVTIVRPSQTYSDSRIPLSLKGKSCYSVIDRILKDKPVIVHGDGKSTWHSTHANDFSKGFVPLVGNMKSINEAYQIVNDEIANWDMIYNHLYKLLNKKPNIIHRSSDFLALSKKYDNTGAFLGDKQYSCVYDTSKIKKINPNFVCEIDIKKGLQMYLEYLESQPEEKIIDDEYDQWCDTIIASYQQFSNTMIGKF
ncbi:MAG: NAD-dependent epimerase/dehydratase family protein [Coprobacillaceae bacterium]